MKLLKSRRAFLRWKNDSGLKYQDLEIIEPKRYPCFVYKTIASFSHEEENANYLYLRDVAGMKTQLETEHEKRKNRN